MRGSTDSRWQKNPPTASRFGLDRDGVHLEGVDFGGAGPAVFLLHGLAGYSGEWTATAKWLNRRARVLAFDARGHGASEREPSDVSRAAHVADVAFVLEQLATGPVVVVSQSLGGITALLLAAERPDLVRGLVMVEAGPGTGGGTAHEANVAALGDALRSWSVPFATRGAAVAFFRSRSPDPEVCANGLEQRADGLWPRFAPEVMTRTLDEVDRKSYWQQWQAIEVLTLVVRAGDGSLDKGVATEMARLGRRVEVVELPGGSHDVHLDPTPAWRQALERFLDALS